jgi:probable F420-dependent oxidoreductase
MTAARRPFRFIAPMPLLGDSVAAWRDELRRIEDLGYASISVSEHVTRGWALDAMGALLAIADATERIRVLSLVLSGDLHHPVMLHKAAATIDVLSDGRLELGLGAGWLSDDARALGADPPSPATRVDRLAETLEILDALFTSDEPVTYRGRQFALEGVLGEPRSTQRPRPPLLVGGGGPRVLALAARHADIVGVHARLPSGEVATAPLDDFVAEALASKVSHVAAAATEAGRDPASLELQFTAYAVDLEGQAPGGQGGLADRVRVGLATPSPVHLAGSVDGIVDQLEGWREALGFSYWKLAGDPATNAVIVARLSGR